MNVLFVCSGNISRSQMAMEYFKRLSNGKTASAGTRVTVPGETIGDRADAQVVLQAMHEDGIDMTANKRTVLTPEVLNDFDKIVVLAEPDRIPAWLSKSPKFEYWETRKVKGVPIEAVREVRDMIKARVRDLVKREAALPPEVSAK